uniref:Uncharacterized protein n=2 Tax=Clytia hemisphaerica TaxID=252671 RepID=A0A7M5XB71_9CNID
MPMPASNSQSNGSGTNSASSQSERNSVSSESGTNSASNGGGTNSASNESGTSSASNGSGTNSATNGSGTNTASNGDETNSASNGGGTNSASDGSGTNSASNSATLTEDTTEVDTSSLLDNCQCDTLGKGLTPFIYTHYCKLQVPTDCCRLCDKAGGDYEYSCVAVSDNDKFFWQSFLGPLDYYCRQDSGALVVNMNS